MKEFSLNVKCNTATELQDALERAAAEVCGDLEAIDGMGVDEMADITIGDAELIEIVRIS